jgi:hypothetical protein
MREKDCDYFENSRRAAYVQREYAMRNPRGFAGYGEDCWGLSAGDGPSAEPRLVDGRRQAFYGYAARGVPYGPDDGTICGSATLSSLVFAPEIALPAIRTCCAQGAATPAPLVQASGFNPTVTEAGPNGGRLEGSFGLDQGMVVMTIENYRSGLLWRARPRNRCIRDGLRRAGFTAAGCSAGQSDHGHGLDAPRPLRRPPAARQPVTGPHDEALCGNARPPDWHNPQPRARLPPADHRRRPGRAGRGARRGGARRAGRLIERHLLGGDCLNYGCVPSKTSSAARACMPRCATPPNTACSHRTSPGRLRARDGAHAAHPQPHQPRRFRGALSAEGIDVFFGAGTFTGRDTVEVDGARAAFQEGADRHRIALGAAADARLGRSRLPDQRNRVRHDRAACEPARDRRRPARLRAGAGLRAFGCRTVIVHDEPLFLPGEERDAALMVAPRWPATASRSTSTPGS